MKTKQQDRFELLVIRRLIRTTDLADRFHALRCFIEKREEYYDEFCDRIYDLSQNQQCLMLDDKGLTHLGKETETDNCSNLCLLSGEDMKGDCVDIIRYVDLALDRLEENLNNYDDMGRTAAKF